MLGNMINVQISREIFHAGSYCGRNYTVHSGISSDDGNVLHNILVFNPDKPLDDFINEVCSKGGTTIEAVTELRNRGTEEIIHDANEKCIRRAAEIGR